MRTPGSADLTAAERSAVKVAMPQRRGIEDATNAMCMTPFSRLGARLEGCRPPTQGAVSRRSSSRGVPEVIVPLARVLDRQPCVPPSVESTAQICRSDAVPLEDARRETRTHAARAVHDERSIAWHFADALLELFVRYVARAGHVSVDVFRSLADVDNRCAFVREAARGARVELLRRRRGVVRRRDRLGVAAHLVEADEGELRPQALGLFLVTREEHDRGPERDDGSTSDREAVVPDDVERTAPVSRAVQVWWAWIEERHAWRQRIAQERQRPAIRQRRSAVIERAHVRVVRRRNG